MTAALLLPLGLVLLAFWLSQVLDLMSMADGDFPGRFDKPLWFAVIVFGLPPGAFLFCLWKWLRTPPQACRAALTRDSCSLGPLAGKPDQL